MRKLRRGSESESFVAWLGQQRAEPDYVRDLINRMRRDDMVYYRESAAADLRWVKCPSMTGEITEALISVLDDSSEWPEVREMAAETVSFHNLRVAVPTLIRCLADPSASGRFWAATSLALSNSTDALPEMRRLAATDFDEVPEYGLVSVAAQQAIDDILENADHDPSR